jgi:hypothetical protein
MGTNVDAGIVSQDARTINHQEVKCIFCGLPTTVPVLGLSTLPNRFPSHISIVRCQLCGKEAPYRNCDISEVSKKCEAQDHPAMPPESAERRRQPRIAVSQVVRIRLLESRLPPDTCTTFNVSQDGVYLSTLAGHYALGANVYITSDFQPGGPTSYAMAGVVVRVEKLKSDKWGVAIHILSPSS